MQEWEGLFEPHIAEIATAEDPAHDLLHIKRVVANAKRIAAREGADLNVVVPAAWLHDCVVIAKNDPRRAEASRLAAESAIRYLSSLHYPKVYWQGIHHAIEAHSFSAQIAPKSVEAKALQDADRLDALGSIGIARCFATAAIMKSSFYSPEDPFCKTRAPDDRAFSVDHFYIKLFRIAETMQTESGKKEAGRRVEFMRSYLDQLASEITL